MEDLIFISGIRVPMEFFLIVKTTIVVYSVKLNNIFSKKCLLKTIEHFSTEKVPNTIFLTKISIKLRGTL